MKKHEESSRWNISLLLMLMAGFCFGMSVFRYYISETKIFLFLNKNLLLACIPFVISSYLVIRNIRSKVLLGIAIIMWVLFFPNSPYIFTDLLHLKMRSPVPLWYDLIMILSFAWTGLIFGFASLNDIKDLLRDHFNRYTVNILAVFLLFLSSFGVYLGRFLRWNSWDILHDPSGLFNDITERCIYPFHHPRTWGMTILMGILLNFMHWVINPERRWAGRKS